MILADPINCTIPSMDALKTKGQEITCTTSLIDSAKGVELMWIAMAAIGALGSFIVTIFMARYAWKAWQAARDQNQRTLEQIELTRDLAMEEQRVPALTDFVRIIRKICLYMDEFEGNEHSKLAVDLEHAAVRWMLSYPGSLKDRKLEILSLRIGTAVQMYVTTSYRIKLNILKSETEEGVKNKRISKEIEEYLDFVCEAVVNQSLMLHHRIIEEMMFEQEITNISQGLRRKMDAWEI